MKNGQHCLAVRYLKIFIFWVNLYIVFDFIPEADGQALIDGAWDVISQIEG
ncbi:MAG: hypothetical protein ABIK28_23975 [Planctomycetota bacterium]